MKKSASALGVAILGLGSSFFATPAMAAELADCGTAPAGGTLTLTGDVCLLTFSTPGSYSFTIPSAAENLAGLLVGGGGGSSYADPAGTTGYAGSGGKVVYVDLAANPAGETVSVTVGGGGLSSIAGTPVDGQSSSFTVAANTTAAEGGKGLNGTWCQNPGAPYAYGVGDGAGGNTPSRAGEPCVVAPGVNPSLATPDSNGLAASTLFASLNQEFGIGGKVFALPASLPTQTIGAGANAVIRMDSAVQGDQIFDVAGGNGFAAIAWQLPAPPKVTEPVALADTGSDAYAPLLVGAGAMALGAVMFSRAGRRRVR